MNTHSGGSRIFQRRERQPQGRGVNLLFGQDFHESCMKMKEFGPRRGARIPGAPLRSANDWFYIIGVIAIFVFYCGRSKYFYILYNIKQIIIFDYMLKSMNLSKF